MEIIAPVHCSCKKKSKLYDWEKGENSHKNNVYAGIKVLSSFCYLAQSASRNGYGLEAKKIYVEIRIVLNDRLLSTCGSLFPRAFERVNFAQKQHVSSVFFLSLSLLHFVFRIENVSQKLSSLLRVSMSWKTGTEIFAGKTRGTFDSRTISESSDKSLSKAVKVEANFRF